MSSPEQESSAADQDVKHAVTLKSQISSIGPDPSPARALGSFKDQRDALTSLLQSNLTKIASKLYNKSIISEDALAEAMNKMHIVSDRTVSLLSVVEAKIKAEPHTFTEFVKILASEPSLRTQAEELVKKYHSTCLTPKSTNAVICRYGDYLEDVYSTCSVSSDGKFPPTPSKKYIKLALVPRDTNPRDLEELAKYTLHGKIDDILGGKRKIEMDDILKRNEDGSLVKLVLVLGPPGIGKSTLAWELCRRWDRKQYDLAVLLRLREREVQQIKDIAGLFPHDDEDLQKSVAKDVIASKGERVLFILDGFDELPSDVRSVGPLSKLLIGRSLPKCTVLVTSRPSASHNLNQMYGPQIQRRVEILGFTQECVTEYASSVFSTEPEVLKDFLAYISASSNPAINSLMYVPLNAAIVVEIYRTYRNAHIATMTKLYTQLSLILLQRDLEPYDTTSIIGDISELSDDYSGRLKSLAHLAFKEFMKQNVVFYSRNVPKEIIHSSFLDSVPGIYGQGGISYNFLHLTLQEFLAAYHITQLSDGIDIFKRYCDDPRWNIVWRFVSGLTSFDFLMTVANNDVFVVDTEEGLEVKTFLLQCLFEAQIDFDYKSALVRDNITFKCDINNSTLDKYALGYCIAKSPATISWDVQIENMKSDESFIWGLKSHSSNGNIRHLSLISTSIHLHCYPEHILQGIHHLEVICDGTVIPPHDPMKSSVLHATDNFMNLIIKVMQQMKNLRFLSLNFFYYSSESMVKIFHNLSKSNVTGLRLGYFMDLEKHSSSRIKIAVDAMAKLIRSPHSKLNCLSITRGFIPDIDDKTYFDVLFGSPSLKLLSLRFFSTSLLKVANSCVLLETNTCLTSLHILSPGADYLPLITKILQRNKTLSILTWGNLCNFTCEHVRKFNRALSINKTLKRLILCVHIFYVNIMHFESDSRLTINFYD